jgi:hypothetical protein
MGEIKENFTTTFGEQLHRQLERRHQVSICFTHFSKRRQNIAVHETRMNNVEVVVRTLRNEAGAATKVNDLIIKGRALDSGNTETWIPVLPNILPIPKYRH